MTAVVPDVGLEHIESTCSIETSSRWILGLSLLIVATIFGAYLLLALPANDDFARASQPRLLGYWPYFCKLYMHWQGRWVSFGLESGVLPVSDMTRIYPALLAPIALIDFLGIYCICRCVTRLASRWFTLACAIGLTAMIWAAMPSVAQAVYWFVGAVENTMVLALAGILLAGLITMRATIPWMIFASVLAIFTTGLHEAYGAMLCIALALGTLAAYWMDSKNKSAWLVVLIAATIGLGIVVGAPGNRHRMKSDGSPHSQQFAYDLKLAATQFSEWSRAWLFDPKLVAVSLWIAFSPRLEASRPIWPNAAKVPWRLLIPLAWLAMLVVGFFAPSWAFGNPMPKRTLSGNFMVFAVGWLSIVFVWTRRIGSRDQALSAGGLNGGLRSAGATAVVRVLLALALVFTGNTMDGIRDLLTRRVLVWRSSVETRFALLRHSKDADLIVKRLAQPSHLLYDNEVTVDPTFWVNTGMSEFFGVKSVRVLPPPTTAPLTVPSTDTPIDAPADPEPKGRNM